MIEAFERHLKNTVVEYELGDIPGPALIEKCKKYLQSEGYIVSSPIKYDQPKPIIHHNISIDKVIPIQTQMSVDTSMYQNDQSYQDYFLKELAYKTGGFIAEHLQEWGACMVNDDYSTFHPLKKNVLVKMFVVPAKDIMVNFRGEWNEIFSKTQ